MQKKIQIYSLSDDLSSLQIVTNIYKDNTQAENFIASKTDNYELKNISKNELLKIRAQREISGFVLKIDNIYLFTELPKECSILPSTILGAKHSCVECPYFSAKLNSEGGCQKVRDASPKEYEMLGFEPMEALQLSERIEKYDFITLGCETFHTHHESFIVASCNRCEQKSS